MRPLHGTPGPPLHFICEADDDVQDEQHAIFHYTHPYTVSLRWRYESLFSENNRLFLSELMDLFVAGRDQSAADQPNYLAEGHPPL